MLEYAHLGGGWYATWKDDAGLWHIENDKPFLFLFQLKRYFPFGHVA